MRRQRRHSSARYVGFFIRRIPQTLITIYIIIIINLKHDVISVETESEMNVMYYYY